MMIARVLYGCLLWMLAVAASAAPACSSCQEIRHRWLDLDGIKMFYREAGDPARPAILLLHGFPSSSQMYEGLMRRLADRFYLVAPDHPGSGHTVIADPGRLTPTFEGLTDTVERFVERKGMRRYVLYVQDFGGPVGFRLAVRHPDRVQGLIVQNANAYEEGLAPKLIANILRFKAGVTPETLPALEEVLSPGSVRFMYTHGMRDASALNPDSWALAQWGLAPAENRRIQMQLLADYHTNVALYPVWQAYFRQHKPRTLVAWGKHDPFFLAAGAHAFAKDIEAARVHLLDTGHFALEEDAAEIARLVRVHFDADGPAR